MNYRLIAATAADEAWLEQLRREVYQALFQATWGGWDEARHARHFAACLARGRICLIEVAGRQLGMLQVFEDAQAIEIGEIQIQAVAQGQGLGRAVLGDLIDRASAERKQLRLSVGLKNEMAYRLYERLGFTCVAQTDTHYHMVCEPRP